MPSQRAREQAERHHHQPDAENYAGEVSLALLHLNSCCFRPVHVCVGRALIAPAACSEFRTSRAYFTRFQPTSAVPPIEAATDHFRSSPAKVMIVRFGSVQFG